MCVCVCVFNKHFSCCCFFFISSFFFSFILILFSLLAKAVLQYDHITENQKQYIYGQWRKILSFFHHSQSANLYLTVIGPISFVYRLAIVNDIGPIFSPICMVGPKSCLIHIGPISDRNRFSQLCAIGPIFFPHRSDIRQLSLRELSNIFFQFA